MVPEVQSSPIAKLWPLLLMTDADYQKLRQKPFEMISRAVNTTCNCAVKIPAMEARDPSGHVDDCPYKKLFLNPVRGGQL